MIFISVFFWFILDDYYTFISFRCEELIQKSVEKKEKEMTLLFRSSLEKERERSTGLQSELEKITQETKDTIQHYKEEKKEEERRREEERSEERERKRKEQREEIATGEFLTEFGRLLFFTYI